MFDKSKAFAYMASIVMSVGYKNNKTKVVSHLCSVSILLYISTTLISRL